MAQTLGSVAVGSIVKIKENGAAVNYIVVHQGKPSSSYDSSCDGTWLLRQGIAENRVWDSGNSNVLESSDIHSYLNNTWINRYDTDIRNAIKQVKIPYRQNGGSGGTDRSGSNGLSCKIFLLSGKEVGWDSSDNRYFPNDGAKLAYFLDGTGSSANSKRVAKLNGSATGWWLRSPYANRTGDVWSVLSGGDYDYWGAGDSYGVRPALILPSSLLVSDDGSITTNTAPTTPPSITIPSSIDGGSTITVSWGTSTDAEGNLEGYIVERQVDGGSWTQIYQGTATSTTNTVAFGTNTVAYRVKAYDAAGLESGWKTSSTVTVTNNRAPSTPANISVPPHVNEGGSVSVSWTASTDPDGNLSGYTLQRSANGGGFTQVYQGASTSYTDTAPTNADTLQYRVQAYDTQGETSGWTTSDQIPVYGVPTLTVPQMVMQGQSATIRWTAVEGADSYTLQRKANTDADWTQVYSGAATTFSETVGSWTSVQYRVQAVFSGTPGGWATSAAISVVSASALVISGTDGDLGTVVNDIPYSISTDTGNQITATITVNSAVIFSGNVGNSTSDVIPVLDLVNGTGTIVIEASVQASGGPVSAVRTWTYTKSPITFPNAGSVAQLTQQGANIFPKTLAECVRLPGGKTLDEVTAFPAQVYTGSYVGTGTYGASNPNTLTFPFEPKAIIVQQISDSANGGFFDFYAVNGATQTKTNHGNNNGSIQFDWSGNGVSWYSVTNSSVQLNYSGDTYNYIVFG